MQRRITAPPHGVNYRVRNGGTVDGFYYLDGRRTTWVLARLANLQRDAPALRGHRQPVDVVANARDRNIGRTGRIQCVGQGRW